MNLLFAKSLIVIKGGGDLASGVAYRLKRAGFPLLMTELAAPLMVRRTVCFGEAVYAGEVEVEGITAKSVEGVDVAHALAESDLIPVLVDPHGTAVEELAPRVLIDAVMAKRNTGTTLADAPLVVALGPGFYAGKDCHALIETMRGHRLGRVIYSGPTAPDTGTPGLVSGRGVDRVLRAPADGYVEGSSQIGDRLEEGQQIATIAGHPLYAPFAGILRGLIHPSVKVKKGLKIGDLDPRGIVDHCFTISDKALSIGGGVLEAVLAFEAEVSR